MPQPWHDHPLAADLDLALAVVREASRLCRHVQASMDLGVLRKEDRSPVTVADFGAQALVCRGLLEQRSDDAVIAEENADVLRQPEQAATLARVVAEVARLEPQADADAVCRWIDHGTDEHPAPRAWTLDPIDGTKGFLRGDQYAVALALLVEGEVALGVLGCPNLGATLGDLAGEGTLYAALAGVGAWRVGVGDEAIVPLRVSTQDDPAQLRFCQSVESAHTSHGDAARVREHLGIVADPIGVDSQAKYAVVARGEAEGYLRLPRGNDYRERIWDHAAGMLVVTAAGGRVSDVAGRPLEFGHGHALVNNRGVVASNGRLHDRLIDALRTLGIADR
jgi:3'(2'), 5'-bisphosphate nucleotidase